MKSRLSLLQDELNIFKRRADDYSSSSSSSHVHHPLTLQQLKLGDDGDEEAEREREAEIRERQSLEIQQLLSEVANLKRVIAGQDGSHAEYQALQEQYYILEKSFDILSFKYENEAERGRLISSDHEQVSVCMCVCVCVCVCVVCVF